MKKKVKKEEYRKIDTVRADGWSKSVIPKGATHFEVEVDYSNCYYEGDTPSYNVNFFKKEN